METRYPELIPLMSTAKSCVEILGQLVRKHEPDAFIVEIMPCTAKKIERKRDNNIDAAITVVEITDYLKGLHFTKEDVQVEQDDDHGFDVPYHFCSGSAFIFGRTGGVGVSVLRQLACQSGA